MPGRRWTDEEDGVLAAYASMGAPEVSRRLRAECGSRRSVQSVQCRASRLGVSLFEHGVCGECGAWTRSRRADGLCPVCAARKSGAASRERVEAMMKVKLGKDQIDAIVRESRDAAAARQELRRYIGRMCGYGGVDKKREK